MKSKLLAIFIICAASASAAEWSLDSCINYALQHNLDIRASELELLQGENYITEAKDGFLPSVSAGASQSWDFGRGLTAQNTYANRNTSMFSWNAQMSLPVFQGLRAIRQLRYSRSNVAMLRLQTEAARDEVRLSVITYYLQVLYNKELLEVSREQLRLSNVQLSRQETLFEGGKVPEVDLLQARAQVAQAEVDVVNSENDYNSSIIELTKLLELPDIEDFKVASVDEEIAAMPDVMEIYDNALANFPALRAARHNVTLADEAIDVAKSGYLPRLNFNAGLGSSYYTISGGESYSFGKQMRDNFSKSLGFSLSVPIFDAFSTRNSVRQAKVRRLNALLQVQQRESDMLKNIRLAHQQAKGAEVKYNAGKIAVETSKAALDAMTEKYTYGKANSSEWEQAQSDYITTLARQVQAKYEMILRNRILRFYNRLS